MLTIISRVESTCSSSKRTRRASSAGSRDGRPPTSAWIASMRPSTTQARIERHREHGGDDQRARTRQCAGRGPSTRHRRQRHQQQRARSRRRRSETVRGWSPKTAAGQLAAGGRRAGLQHLEGRRAPRPRQARPSRPARRPARARTRTAARASGHYNDHRRSLRCPCNASSRVPALTNIATRLRIDSVRCPRPRPAAATRRTCCSAAEIMAALFFSEMRYDPRDPQNPDNDRFVLSKGHAAPMLYAAWAEAGIIPREDLLKLRTLRLRSRRTSDAAAAVGGRRHRIARPGALRRRRHRAQRAPHQVRLPHLRAARRRRDRRRLGLGSGATAARPRQARFAVRHHRRQRARPERPDRSGSTTWTRYAARWRAFGWHAIVVDGHDMAAILAAFDEARRTQGPADDDPRADDQGQGHLVRRRQGRLARQAAQEGRGGSSRRSPSSRRSSSRRTSRPRSRAPPTRCRGRAPKPPAPLGPPPYTLGDKVATREAYGDGARPARRHRRSHRRARRRRRRTRRSARSSSSSIPSASIENFIAEQVMIGAAMGLAARGAIPFPSTFAAFLTRAYDFIRMAAISNLNIKMAGSHAGVSIGEDGPSQMALEDLAMMRAQPNITVLYPCDAVSTERLIERDGLSPGPGVHAHVAAEDAGHLRPRRDVPRSAGSRCCAQSGGDVGDGHRRRRHGVRGARRRTTSCRQQGISIRVIDLYCAAADRRRDARALRARDQGPADHGRGSLRRRRHRRRGGRGGRRPTASPCIASRCARFRAAARPSELLDHYGISARHIVDAVNRRQAGLKRPRRRV